MTKPEDSQVKMIIELESVEVNFNAGKESLNDFEYMPGKTFSFSEEKGVKRDPRHTDHTCS